MPEPILLTSDVFAQYHCKDVIRGPPDLTIRRIRYASFSRYFSASCVLSFSAIAQRTTASLTDTVEDGIEPGMTAHYDLKSNRTTLQVEHLGIYSFVVLNNTW
jgi:hypothetical protein